MKESSKYSSSFRSFVSSWISHFFAHVVAFILTAAMIYLTYFLARSNQPELEKGAFVLILLMAGIMVGILIVRYLGGTSSSIKQTLYEQDKIYQEVTQHISELKAELNFLANDNKDELITLLTQRLKAEASENFLSDLKLQLRKDEIQLNLSERGKTTLSRIYGEIDALSRRGNINLVLGVIMALGGAGVLAYFSFNDVRPHEDVAGFAISFLPRLSLVIIIEVFSFFFLKLYKASLSEIKYFQNEATNIEFHFAALEVATHLGDAKLIEKTIGKFTNVERNPILKDNDMTRELKSEIASERGIKLSPEYLAEFLRIISPNNRENKPEK